MKNGKIYIQSNMKKFSYFVFAFLAASCSNDFEIISNGTMTESANMSGVFMNISDFIFEGDTRTELTPTSNGISFTWKAGDKVGIYTESTSMANFDINQISQDAKSASFNGGGFSLTEGSTYYAFYPYNAENTDKTIIYFDYTGQVQKANNDCSHLALYDYMSAKSIATGTNEALFDFDHLGSVIKIKISLPHDGVFTKLTLKSTKAIPVHGSFDITQNTPILNIDETSKILFLDLDNVVSINEHLTLYMLLPSCDLYGQDIDCQLLDNLGNIYNGYIAGKNLLSGNAYGFILPVFENPHDCVDLGVVVDGKSVYWATTNIGAVLPADNGLYFAWGETMGYTEDTSDSREFDWASYSTDLADGNYRYMKKYCTSSSCGFVDNKTILDPEDDAAHVNWHGLWRMPTRKELDALRTQCDWTWISMTNSEGKSVEGYKVSNTSDSSKFIFLPAAGTRIDSYLVSVSSCGCYWSSSLVDDNSYSAYYMSAGYNVECSDNLRSVGLSVRPVCQ